MDKTNFEIKIHRENGQSSSQAQYSYNYKRGHTNLLDRGAEDRMFDE